MSIRKGQNITRLSVIVASMIIGLLAITTYGCGGNTESAKSGNTPSEIVEQYYQLLKEKDCEGLADYINDNQPELVERRVKECKQSTNIELESYSIISEEIDGSGRVAYVEVEATIKEDSVEKTNHVTQSLVKQDDEWKIHEVESRT